METTKPEDWMLGLDNPIHVLFLLLIVLLVFGAKRLPEMGRSLGSGLRGFRDSLSGESPGEPVTVHAHNPVPEPASQGASQVETTSQA